MGDDGFQATAASRVPHNPAHYLAGIDIGGTGSRIAVLPFDAAEPAQTIFTANGPGATVGADGVCVDEALQTLCDKAVAEIPGAVFDAVAVGMTGFATLTGDPTGLCHAVAAMFDCLHVALAADAVTAHLGALGGRAGAVVVAGTGVIGFGADHHGTVTRVDGWGHLLGDHGGGAWIGMHGLQCALDAYSGRYGAPSPMLLERAIARFGDPGQWPKQLYTRDDRAGILASFAPDVMACAVQGDGPSAGIIRRAGEELAATARASLTGELPKLVAFSGSIIVHCPVIRETAIEQLHRIDPGVDVIDPLGTPLDGAARLAMAVSRGDVRDHAPCLAVLNGRVRDDDPKQSR